MDFLKNLGIEDTNAGTSTGQNSWSSNAGNKLESITPTDGSHIADTSLHHQRRL